MSLNIPTLLTWMRIAGIPIIMVIYYGAVPQPIQNLCATGVFIALGVTDWLDGYLARKWGQTSAFGAFLDPVADKILVCACMIILLHLQRVEMLLALVIIGREIAISSLREWMAQMGASSHVAVHWVGKFKTTAQMLAIGCLLYHDRMVLGGGLSIDGQAVGTVLMWVAALLTLWSMLYYMWKARVAVARAGEKKRSA